MALIIEDGTEVANANSYVSEAELQAFMDARNILPLPDTVDAEAALIKATDYLESFRSRYQGTRTTITQSLEWPREDVYLNCADKAIENDVIPTALKNAQMEAALAIFIDAIDLLPNYDASGNSGKVVIEKVGPITVKYDDTGFTTSTIPSLAKVQNWLEPLFYPCGQSGYLKNCRA